MEELIYDSLDDWVTAAEKAKNGYKDFYQKQHGVSSVEQLVTLARSGWDHLIDETDDIAANAIETVAREYEMPAWTAKYDVSGGDVDVAAFLSGDPECMVESVPVRIAKVGRVITICASQSVSGAVSQSDILKRGRVMMNLVTALKKLDYGVDLWVDISSQKVSGVDDASHRIRANVLKPGDVLDLPKLTYALCHPSVCRGLAFRTFPIIGLTQADDFGVPRDPVEDLPEGTIYFKCGHLNNKNADYDKILEQQLRELDILR